MTTLQVGDKAPNFKALNQNNESVQLSDFKGSKLVLYFYPKANTPSCTKQACSLRDGIEDLKKADYQVLGVSPDKPKSLTNFIAKQNLNFDLLSDPEKEVANAYQVWGEKKFMGKIVVGIHRITFLIDENGIIENIIRKPITKDHANQILQL